MKSIQLLKKIIIDKLLPVGLLAAAVFIFDIQCPIQATFGIPCPGCNMTTALYYLLHGDIKSAWFFHPAVFLLMVSMIIVLVLQLFQKRKWIKRVLYVTLFLYLFIYFYRMIVIYPKWPMIYVENNRLNNIIEFFR